MRACSTVVEGLDSRVDELIGGGLMGVVTGNEEALHMQNSVFFKRFQIFCVCVRILTCQEAEVQKWAWQVV